MKLITINSVTKVEQKCLFLISRGKEDLNSFGGGSQPDLLKDLFKISNEVL